MKSILVPLYWLWCGVSVFVLVRRRVSKKAESAPTDLSDAGAPSAALEDPFAPFATSGPEAGAGAPSPALAAPLVQPPPTTPMSVPPPPVIIPPPPQASIAAPSTHARALSLGIPVSKVDSLAEALEGISLPCDLVPLTGTGEFDPKTLVLLTREHPADVVGTAVADEIESLGYTLAPLDDHRLMASTDDAAVEITVFADSSVADDTGTRRFPTAGPDSVVVELRLR